MNYVNYQDCGKRIASYCSQNLMLKPYFAHSRLWDFGVAVWHRACFVKDPLNMRSITKTDLGVWFWPEVGSWRCIVADRILKQTDEIWINMTKLCDSSWFSYSQNFSSFRVKDLKGCWMLCMCSGLPFALRAKRARHVLFPACSICKSLDFQSCAADLCNLMPFWSLRKSHWIVGLTWVHYH